MKITKDELEKLGISWVGSKIYPHKFFVPHVGDVNLYEPYTMDQVFEHIYQSGLNNGIRQGEQMKIDQIKEILDI